MKLDPTHLRYLGTDEFRVLQAVAMALDRMTQHANTYNGTD